MKYAFLCKTQSYKASRAETSSREWFLKKSLSIKYKNKRKVYTKNEISKNYNLFLKDYPVILSTTYSSRNTFDDNMKILISNKLSCENVSRINIDTNKIYVNNPSNEMMINMRYHRQNIFVQ